MPRGNLQSAHTTDVELNLGCAHWAIRIIRGRSATESSGREVIETGDVAPNRCRHRRSRTGSLASEPTKL